MSFTRFLIVCVLVPPLPLLLLTILKIDFQEAFGVREVSCFSVVWAIQAWLSCAFWFCKSSMMRLSERQIYIHTYRQTDRTKRQWNRQDEFIRKWYCPQQESLSGDVLLTKEKYQVFSVLHENQNRLGRGLSHHSVCLERTKTSVWHSLPAFMEKLGTGAQACNPSTGERALWTATLVYLANSRPVREPVDGV